MSLVAWLVLSLTHIVSIELDVPVSWWPTILLPTLLLLALMFLLFLWSEVVIVVLLVVVVDVIVFVLTLLVISLNNCCRPHPFSLSSFRPRSICQCRYGLPRFTLPRRSLSELYNLRCCCNRCTKTGARLSNATYNWTEKLRKTNNLSLLMPSSLSLSLPPQFLFLSFMVVFDDDSYVA